MGACWLLLRLCCSSMSRLVQKLSCHRRCNDWTFVNVRSTVATAINDSFSCDRAELTVLMHCFAPNVVFR